MRLPRELVSGVREKPVTGSGAGSKPGSENSICKDPGVGTCLGVFEKSCQEPVVARKRVGEAGQRGR
jgi:hypothetical protein